MYFRWGLEIRKQTKKPKPGWKSTSEHHSEVVVSLLFWEFQFKGLKMSSWQQGLCGKIGGEAKLLPLLLCLPDRAEGAPWCFSHCQEPLSPSVPSAEGAAVGSSCDGCGLEVQRGYRVLSFALHRIFPSRIWPGESQLHYC